VAKFELAQLRVLTMKWAALITWLVTAGDAFILLAIWLAARESVRQQREAANRIYRVWS
jgi:hypothetical protein